jgi:hypothetical protein
MVPFRFILRLAVLFSLFGFPISAALAATAGPALPLRAQFLPGLETHVKVLLEEWWEQSLGLLRKYPPRDFGPNLLEWNADRAVLRHKQFAIIFVNREFSENSDKKMGPPANPDIVTQFFLSESEKIDIFVRVTSDSFFDVNKRAKGDAFGVFFTALLRELYSNVQEMLEHGGSLYEYARMDKSTRELPVESRSSKGTIDVLEQVLGSKDAGMFNAESQQYLLIALGLEQTTLALLQAEAARRRSSCESDLNPKR